MTPANSSVYAVNGQLYNFSGVIRSSSTGNPIVSGLTGLAASISKNDGAFVSTVNTPVEVGTDSGFFSLDLTAAEMTANKILVVISATNSAAVYWTVQIQTVNLGQSTGRYDAQPVVLLEKLLLDLYSGIGLNGASQTGAALQMLNPDGSTHFSGAVVQNTTSGTRSKMI